MRETHVYHDAPAPRRTTTRTTTVHHHHTPRRAYRYSAPVRRRTTVHHHHRYPNRGGSTVVTTQPRQRVAPKRVENPTTAYLTAGLGASGILAPQVNESVLSGSDFNVGLGGRSGWVAAELGFTMGGYQRAQQAGESDVTTLGLTADLKLQPTFSIIEPYASVGVGGHVLNDHFKNNSATGGSLRLGAGVDVRIQNVAISAQYMHMQYNLLDNGTQYEGGSLGAASDTIGLGLKFYF